ncbi:glycosyltransferase family 1 protein [Maribacter sp. BPC-D8]|uniref:glycosyltransferase family 4 protein n=1 Tax=Maribacter sp. BPC-D8 TaxID=3053613 RepID=UPI002B48577D|nr:glycosyltransferase family 1 protein [Maribacter sp. BPC-D8]WRI28322.1 glycosyltransferase family 1 protein [Maribacter sp. BPC-D8]
MKIQYFFRHPHVGHSIHRVFRTIITEISKTEDTTIIEVPNKGSMPWDVIKNNLFVYRKRNKHTIHHITGHIHDVLMALIGVKTVLTIHDLVFLDNVKNPVKHFYKWLFWLYLPIKIADKVVCISNQTKKNILSKINTDKIIVIHNAIDPIFTCSKKPFNSEKPIILHIGTGWNKNLERTIEALEGISCHLRVIEKLKDNQIKLLTKYNIDYSNQYDLTDEEIREEYLKCDIVNFPSVYEGFGMPVIEGQQTGRVVITSNIEPIIEIAGNAAVFLNPWDVNSMRDAYSKVLKDYDLQNELIIKGLENVKRFSIENISQQYITLYRNLNEI